jgi:hypothetical protein
MEESNGNTIKWRVGQLEEGYKGLNGKIDKIMNNHLPHLASDIQSLKTSVSLATVINIGAIILAAVLLKYL